MLFSEMVDDIRIQLQSYFNLSGMSDNKDISLTTVMIENWINEALYDLSAIKCINENRDLLTATYTSATNISSLLLPDDLVAVTNMGRLNSSNNITKLNQIENNLKYIYGNIPIDSYVIIDEKDVNNVNKKKVMIGGNTGIDHIVIDCYVLHEKMSSTEVNQNIRIPIQYHSLILNYAKSKAYDFASSIIPDQIKSSQASSLSNKLLQLYIRDKRSMHAECLWYGKNEFKLGGITYDTI